MPFALPGCEIRHDPELDLWFERVNYIPGVSFTPAVAATVTHDAMMVIARQMAAFLNAVHALPLAPAREVGMDEMDPTGFWDYMENIPDASPWFRRTLWPIVTTTTTCSLTASS